MSVQRTVAMTIARYGRELLPIAFAGACFGVARAVSGSTSVAVTMHAIYNLTIFSAFIAQGGLNNLK